jgi:hypothetical protein
MACCVMCVLRLRIRKSPKYTLVCDTIVIADPITITKIEAAIITSVKEKPADPSARFPPRIGVALLRHPHFSSITETRWIGQDKIPSL